MVCGLLPIARARFTQPCVPCLDLILHLESLQHAHEAEQPELDQDGEVAQAMAEAEALAKSESVAPVIRQRARKAAESLALSHLHKMSPAAARAYEARQSV
jgi:hypothetical protein